MTSPFFLAAVRKEFARLRRDPLAVILWAGIPLVIAILLASVFGRGRAVPHGTVIVVDHDGSLASRAIPTVFSQGPLAEMFSVEQAAESEARERLNAGGASAVVIVPAEFGRRFLRSEPAQLTLITNPSQRILPAIVSETLAVLCEGGSFLQMLLGPQLRIMANGPPPGGVTLPDTTIATISAEINRLARTVFPLPFQLETTANQEPQRNMAELFLPGMIFLGLLFVAQGLAVEIWKERGSGALRRLLASPAPLEAFLAAKLVSVWILLAVVTLVGLSAGYFLLGLPLRRPLLLVLWPSLAALCFFALFQLLALMATSQRGAQMLSAIFLFPLGMIGGSFFPFDSMPRTFAAVGRLTPNGWAVSQFAEILAGRVDGLRLATGAAAFLVLILAASVLSARRLRALT